MRTFVTCILKMPPCLFTYRQDRMENNRRRTNIDFSLPDFWKLQRDWSIQRSPEDERLRVVSDLAVARSGFNQIA